MTVNETIVTGRKFRKCVDATNKLWQRISFWTKSSDVEFEDGKTAEAKLGAIDGITDSLNETSSNLAASAKAVATLNQNLQGFTPIVDATGKITGYKTTAGADTVFPFSGGLPNSLSYYSQIMDNVAIQSSTIATVLIPKNCMGIVIVGLNGNSESNSPGSFFIGDRMHSLKWSSLTTGKVCVGMFVGKSGERLSICGTSSAYGQRVSVFIYSAS